MKLNQDLVRLILSAVEASPEPVNLSELTFDGFSSYDVRNHLKELFRRGYISGEVNKYLASTDYIASFLTPAGSAYLKELNTSGLNLLHLLLFLWFLGCWCWLSLIHL